MSLTDTSVGSWEWWRGDVSQVLTAGSLQLDHPNNNLVIKKHRTRAKCGSDQFPTNPPRTQERWNAQNRSVVFIFNVLIASGSDRGLNKSNILDNSPDRWQSDLYSGAFFFCQYCQCFPTELYTWIIWSDPSHLILLGQIYPNSQTCISDVIYMLCDHSHSHI